jgi:hypothetical protein
VRHHPNPPHACVSVCALPRRRDSNPRRRNLPRNGFRDRAPSRSTPTRIWLHNADLIRWSGSSTRSEERLGETNRHEIVTRVTAVDRPRPHTPLRTRSVVRTIDVMAASVLGAELASRAPRPERGDRVGRRRRRLLEPARRGACACLCGSIRGRPLQPTAPILRGRYACASARASTPHQQSRNRRRACVRRSPPCRCRPSRGIRGCRR